MTSKYSIAANAPDGKRPVEELPVKNVLVVQDN